MITAEDVKRRAAEIGFAACGVTSLEPSARQDAFDRWLAAGYAGTMRYLHRQAARRKEPARIVSGARRVIVVLENYAPDDGERPAPDDAFKIAAYARGMDYHIVTLARLRVLAEWLLAHGAGVAHAWVDDGPTPDRELAERAGLGWIGKNTMLIHPRVGSWTFIGLLFTDLELDIDRAHVADHCGSCTRCLDACPTGALVAERTLDATRCLSYLTIEYKGEFADDAPVGQDGWVFGCDACNAACPWNVKFATPTTVDDFRRRPGIDRADADYFESLDQDEFDRRFGDTPLARPGLDRMRRNVRATRLQHTSRS